MEKAAVQIVIALGEQHGYGNMIAHLATAWAVKLRGDGLDEKTAIAHVSGRGPYTLPPK